ncbi:MAG: hypothetical protein V9F03_05365 [Microthrixaceae bacterium]
MSSVLIRDVPDEVVASIRLAAANEGVSMQSYLLATLHNQVRYLRRADALDAIAQRLQSLPAVSDTEREAVLDEIEQANRDRGDDLGGRDPGPTELADPDSGRTESGDLAEGDHAADTNIVRRRRR